MILVDENTREDQRKILVSRRLPVRQVGVDWGRKGMSDEEIVTALHSSRRVTLLTRDSDFYYPGFRHPNYAVVVIAAPVTAMAEFAIRFLRHPVFRSHAMRLGKVIRVQPTGIVYWERNASRETEVAWSQPIVKPSGSSA